MLLEGWMEDPIACCEKSGVQPPTSLKRENNGATVSSPLVDDPLVLGGAASLPTPYIHSATEAIVSVLVMWRSRSYGPAMMVTSCVPVWYLYVPDPLQRGPCAYDMWTCFLQRLLAKVDPPVFIYILRGQRRYVHAVFRYLTGKIQEGNAHNITCPGFNCMKLVPAELIETLVSKDMARRYLQFDIKVT